VQQALHAGRSAGLDHLVGQGDVGVMKTAAPSFLGIGVAGRGFVKDANQVDDGIDAGEQALEVRWIVDIRFDDFHAGKHDQILGVFPPPGGNADFAASGGELSDEMVADEAAATQYADSLDGHGEIDEWKRDDFNARIPRT
jgi:hypothetical protein